MENLPHYLSIVVVLILTGCGLPLPEEVPIIAAGVASSGAVPRLDPLVAYGCCIVGALIGDTMLYVIGYHFGHNLMKAHPRLARLLHAEREAKVAAMINRHGLKALFVARFMVGIRGPVYLTIGILRTSYRTFLLFDAVCATAVVSVFFWMSYLFGEQIKPLVRGFEKIFTGVVIVVVLGWLLFYWVRSRLHKEAEIDVIDASDSPSDSGMR